MTDYFALLGTPRRPWLEAEELKSRFLARSADAHPDRVHGAAEAVAVANERFAALNAAYQCLRDPKDRLLHLLELELGDRPPDVQRLPPGTMELFAEVGQLCRAADAFLAGRGQVTSPILRVQMFGKAMDWTDRLGALQRKLNALREDVFARLSGLNAVWDSAPPVGAPNRRAALPLDQIEHAYRALGYLKRWTEQVQERVVQLSL